MGFCLRTALWLYSNQNRLRDVVQTGGVGLQRPGCLKTVRGAFMERESGLVFDV